MAADLSISVPLKAAAPPSRFAEFWGSLQENRGAVIGLVVLVLIVLTAIFADVLAPHSPLEQYRQFVRLPPAWYEGGSWTFPLGTDALGRDMLSRVMHGARYSLFIGISVMAVGIVCGVALGLVAAYFGGWTDTVISRVMDLIVAVPSLVLAILIIAILQNPSLEKTIVAVTIVQLPRYVRLVRGSALTEMSKDYVTAAKVAGVGQLRLMLRTVLPNCLAPVIVAAALGVSDAIIEAAALGFLGLGAQPPTPEWGAMVGDGRDFVRSEPWIVTIPGLAILVTVISINLFGDGLRDALDPKLKRS
jgi:dipeptide transport system permease protein